MDIISWTAATLMSMYMLLGSQTSNSDYVYNAEMQDGKISAILSYKTSDTGSTLTANTKHVYEYDEQQRVISNQTLKWNIDERQWVPEKCIEFEYDGITIAMNYRKWDKRSNSYMAPSESMVYTMMGTLVTSVEKYKKSNRTGELELADHYILMGGGIYNTLARK